MKRLLRALLLLQLRRPKGLWVALAVATLLLGLGVRRVERRLDLMSLLPTEHPVVKASLEAGVGRQELLWLAAEGTSGDLEARRAWAENALCAADLLVSENALIKTLSPASNPFVSWCAAQPKRFRATFPIFVYSTKTV